MWVWYLVSVGSGLVLETRVTGVSVMFRINVYVDSFSKQGLNAVDFCRRFGIEPAAKVYLSGHHVDNVCRCDVGEDFARSWFGPDETSDSVVVPHTALAPGELVTKPGGSAEYGLKVNVESADRVKELYVLGRFNAIKAERDEAVAEMEAARSAIDEVSVG